MAAYCRFRRIGALVAMALIAGGGQAWPAITEPQNEPVDWRIEHVAGVRVTEVRELLSKLKQAVANRDVPGTCGLAHYPLRVSGGVIRGQESCAAQYSTIFNKKVVSAIANQQFETLFVNWQGVMVGRGEVWMSGVCQDKDCKQYEFRIVTINN